MLLVFAQVAEVSTEDHPEKEAVDIMHNTSADQQANLRTGRIDRDSTAAVLHERHTALQAIMRSLTDQAVSLLTPPFSQSISSIPGLAKSVCSLQSASNSFATALQQVAEASQHLPDRSNTAASSGTAEWQVTAFVVRTVQTVLASGDGVEEDEAADQHVSSPASQTGAVTRAREALQASLSAWNQTILVPSLVSQLQQSAMSLISSEEQLLEDQVNSMDPNLLQDLSALELETATNTANGDNTDATTGSKGFPPKPELVPFNDFDNTLEGADQSLESGLEDSDAGKDANLKLDPQASSLSSNGNFHSRQADSIHADLVPFDAFDDDLGGAGESWAAAGDTGALEAEDSPLFHSSQDDALPGPTQRLSEGMSQYLHAAGAVATAEQQEAVVATARAQAQARLEAGGLAEQLVALEWEHEVDLQEALQTQGGLDQPIVVNSKVSHTLSCRRLFLLKPCCHVRLAAGQCCDC